jgi:predicted membrane channel-forming protein YqfA (hemolysin III family)
MLSSLIDLKRFASHLPLLPLIKTVTIDGIPIYSRAELLSDAVVHFASISWAVVSGCSLLRVTCDVGHILYSASLVAAFTASALFNLFGCGLQIRALALQRLDYTCICVYVTSSCSIMAAHAYMAAAGWVLCLICTAAVMRGALPLAGVRVALGLIGFAPPLSLDPSSTLHLCVLRSQVAMAVGVAGGYQNWRMKHSNTFWHACVLLSFALFWEGVYSRAQDQALTSRVR